MTVTLTGLDGSNPLGFLAALGTLLSLEHQGVSAHLSWEDHGVWRPLLHGLNTIEDVVQTVISDLDTWRDEPAIELQYTVTTSKSPRVDHDLKPPPEVFRRFADQMRERGGRSAALTAAYGSEMALDNGGSVKPTALHFLAGQQRFLHAVIALRDHLGPDHLDEALRGPWRYESPLPVLGWDAKGAREHATRAFDPSKDKKHGVPAADWLAFVALPLFPVAPKGEHLLTTGATGYWKHGAWTWPLWRGALSGQVIASLMQQATALAQRSAAQRLAWGVVEVCHSAIHRSDQGGYGAFSPAEVL